MVIFLCMIVSVCVRLVFMPLIVSFVFLVLVFMPMIVSFMFLVLLVTMLSLVRKYNDKGGMVSAAKSDEHR
jgi:hypothetical protein